MNKTFIDEKKINYRMFKRTFLKKVCAEIDFPKVSFSNNLNKLSEYINSTFELDVHYRNDEEIESLVIEADDNSISFTFWQDKVRVEIESEFYKNYKDTLSPCFRIMLKYLEAFNVKSDICIKIFKTNVWLAKTHNSLAIWRSALNDTFSDENIKIIADSKWDSDKSLPIKLSKNAQQIDGKKELSIKFEVEIPDQSHFKFLLVIKGENDNLKIEDIIPMADDLNLKIFGAFEHLVSDKVLKLMEED